MKLSAFAMGNTSVLSAHSRQTPLSLSLMILLTAKPLKARALAAAMLLALVSLCFAAPAFATRTERLIDDWKPTHYKVDLTFNEKLTEITSARAEITILSLNDSL